MATIQEAIRRLTIWATTPGVAESEVALNRLAAAQGGVAVASQVTERAAQSLDQKFAQLERRYNSQIRAEQDYEKVKRQVNAAVAQNPALQDRANALLAQAADKYGQVTGLQKAMATASQSLNLQVAALAGNLGLTGQVLSAFGPWGFAAAVGLGALESAISLVSDKSHELASKAKEIKEFSEATGLSTTAFQALRSEAGKFGIDSETMASGLSKFTAGFEDLRNGQGALLTDIRRINPAIADQMQRTTDAATAFTLFGKAVSETDNIFQRNQLLKAGMGKGSAVFGAFFDSKPDVAALSASFAAAGKGIDENLIKKLAQLEIDINKTRNAANTVFSSMFGTSTLENELEFQKGLLVIAQTLKEFSLSDDLKKFIDWITSPSTLIALGAIATGAAILSGGTLLAVGGVGLAGAGVYGASRDSIRSAGRSASNDNRPSPIPAAPNFDATFGAVTKSNAATGTRTQLADIADMEKRIAMLGSAATASEKYEVAIEKLKVGQDGLKLSGEQLNRAQEGLWLDRDAAIISNKIGALGAAASVTDLLAQKENALAKAQLQGTVLTDAQIANARRLVIEQANGVGAINSQIDALGVQQKTMGMSVGAAAEYTAVQTKLNEGIRNGNPLSAQQEAALRKVAAALRDKTQAAANDNELSRVNFDRQTLFLSDTERQIAQINFRLHGNDWKAYTDDALSNTIRLTVGIRDAKDTAQQFASSFVQGLLQGKTGMQALTAAADQLAAKMADKALTDLFSGNFLQAGVEAVIAIGASLFSNNSKGQERLKQAQAAWATAGPAFEAFLKQMSGGVQGNLSQQIQQASAQEAAFEKQAWDARDTAAINAARAGLQKFSDTQKRLFQATFQATIDALNDGLGLDSPFAKAVNNVKTALNAQLAFIDDADVAIGGNIPGAMAKAHAASQSYLLSLLQQAPALSAVQAGMLGIQGTANALQGALVQLGMSSADAATAIAGGVTKAVANLKTQFQSGLTSRLNTATGATFLNDAAAAIQQHQQDLADAAALGNDPTLLTQIATLFRAESQKIVNDAGLVGDAFANFTKQFPQLAGVVTQASQDVADAVKQQQSALNSSAKTIVDYVASITAGPSSTSSPQDKFAAAQAVYFAKLALAQAGNLDAQNTVAQDFENYRQAAREMYGSSVAYQQILTTGIAQLLNLPAVQKTTDPVVAAMRDVLTAINAGNATQATDATLQGMIKTAIDAGNAQQIAALLIPKFDTLNTTADGKLTFSQFVTGLGPQYAALATDQRVSSLLTDSQLRAAGIPVNGPITDAQLRAAGINVTGPITAGQLASAGLLTGQGLLNANILTDAQLRAAGVSVNGPVTDAQLRAAGVNVNGPLTDVQLRAVGISVNGPITSAQMGALGLSLEQGNVLNVFRELDNNGDGILEKSELIKAATQATNTNAASTATNTANTKAALDAANLLNDAIKTATEGMRQWGAAGVLDAIKGLNDTAATQLTLLKSALNPTSPGLTQIIGYSSPHEGSTTEPYNFNVTNQMVVALNKIVWNTFATANNVRQLVTNGNDVKGTYATGGWISGGIAGVDSVRILAQRDEFMVNPYATRALTRDYGAGIMEMINAGMLPRVSNDNSRFSAANVVDLTARRQTALPIDNGQHFAVLAQKLIGAAAGISMTEMNAMKEENAKLRALVSELIGAVRGNKPKPARPNQRTGTDG